MFGLELLHFAQDVAEIVSLPHHLRWVVWEDEHLLNFVFQLTSRPEMLYELPFMVEGDPSHDGMGLHGWRLWGFVSLVHNRWHLEIEVFSSKDFPPIRVSANLVGLSPSSCSGILTILKLLWWDLPLISSTLSMSIMFFFFSGWRELFPGS